MKEKIITYFGEILIWVLVYFSPTYSMILSIGFLVLSDMITGVQASKKRGELFTSKKLRNTAAKFMAYGIGILVAHVIERQFISDFPAMKLISGFIAYIELKSINENIEGITGLNLFKMILEKLTPNK